MLFLSATLLMINVFWGAIGGLTAKGSLKGLILDKDIQLKSTVCILLAPFSQNFVCWRNGPVP